MKVIVADEASWTACQKSLNDALYADPDGEEEIYFQFPDGTARKITVETWNRDPAKIKIRELECLTNSEGIPHESHGWKWKCVERWCPGFPIEEEESK